MRRSVLSAVLATLLTLVACSDQPTEVSPPQAIPIEPGALAVVGCPANTTAGEILTLVNQLLPRTIRTSLIARINALPPRAQDRIKMAVRRRVFPIIDLILRSFYAGRLNGGRSDATFAKVLELIKALHCYVGITPPSLPGTTSGSDIVVGVAFPNVETTLSTPSGNAALFVPSNAVTTAMGPATIAIFDLPSQPPPLRTSLDQYPPFYHFSGTTAAGPVVFNADVTAGICFRGSFAGDPADLRLAHNVGPDFGDVEVLPRPDVVPGLPTCTTIGSIGGGELGRFAWAKKLFFPAELHAQGVPLIEKVGGTTRKFSEFAIVDQESNPASLDYNPDQETFSELSAPPNGAVTPAPSVVVRSSNGTPIASVPVEFTVGEEGGEVNGGSSATVLTNANGIASLTSWTLGETPGTYTVTATPPDIDQIGTVEPYNPAARFDPPSLLFTATAVSPIELSIASGNDQSGFANQILTDPLVVQATQNGSAAQGVPITFHVSTGGGSIAPTTVATNADGFAEANWTLGSTIGTQTATASAPGATPVTFAATAAAAPPARIVLQWGTTPSDLDAHLTGPDPAPAETRFHVYYASPGNLAAAPFAALDRDDTDGLGPETITISQMAVGDYRFSVHDYSNLGSTESSALALSGATVTVYLASGASQVFNVPNLPGTLWTVFTLSGDEIESLNSMSYESNPSDTEAFSLFGRTAAAMQSDAAVISDATARHPK